MGYLLFPTNKKGSGQTPAAKRQFNPMTPVLAGRTGGGVGCEDVPEMYGKAPRIPDFDR